MEQNRVSINNLMLELLSEEMQAVSQKMKVI